MFKHKATLKMPHYGSYLGAVIRPHHQSAALRFIYLFLRRGRHDFTVLMTFVLDQELHPKVSGS